MNRMNINADYFNNTTLNPFAIIILLFLIYWIFTCPKNKIILSIIFLSCFIPQGQRVVLLGLDFTFLRILVLFGWVRLIIKKEFKDIILNNLDYSIIFYSIIQIITFTILFSSFAALINKLGSSFDSIGSYFLFRHSIKKKEDILIIINSFEKLSFPILLFFLIERSTGTNIFGYLGGVPIITRIRDGRLRVQGAFSHPILAGCYWASLLPFFVSNILCFKKGNNITIFAIINTLVIVILCASSTPVLSIVFGIIGFMFIFFHKHMKIVRLSFVFFYILLEIVMKAPAYHLISRIDISGGSTGWHRFNLINQAIINWKEWFLVGVQNIDNWGIHANDITNQYIAIAINGGFISLIFFLLIITFAFQNLGIIIKQNILKMETQLFAWLLGVSLFIHLSNFIAVSYFGQIMFLWYLNLAIIGSFYQSQYITTVERVKKTCNKNI